MCLTSWSIVHPVKWQSNFFCSKLHKYIINISKQWTLSDSLTREGGLLFCGGKVHRSQWLFFLRPSLQQHNSGRRHFKQTHGELIFLPGTDTVFLAEMWPRFSRTDRMTEASPGITAVFFPSCKLPKTIPMTSLLLFGPVTAFLFYLMSEGSDELSDCGYHQIGTLHRHIRIAVKLSGQWIGTRFPHLKDCEWGY